MARVDVEHHAARGQRFEDVAGLGFGLLPEKRCCFGREGLDRKQRDEFGLCRREQDFEDLKQKLGRRSPLREAVDPLRQFAIALSGGVVGHGNSVGQIGRGERAGIRGVCSLLVKIYPRLPVSTDASDTVFVGNTGNRGNYRNRSPRSDSLVTHSKTGYYRGSVVFVGACR